MIKAKRSSLKLSHIGASFALFMLPIASYADTTTTSASTPPDYNTPVCKGLEDDEDACLAKLKSFCSIKENEPYKDCQDWKQYQENAKNDANNDPNESAPSSSGKTGGGMASALMFSPTAFASQQSISLIQEIFTCKDAMSEEEKALPNRLGANLCIYVGEYCSKTKRILGIKLCQTKKKAYCCYNSTLARIINTEGNKQLGRGMGDPESATCQGFTIDEFSKLDLSKMDLSEFVAEVTAKVQNTSSKNQDYWEKRNDTRLSNTWQNVDNNTDNLAYKILSADDPYSVASQPTDGRASTQQAARTVASETEANTPTAKETGKTVVNQQDLDTAKQRFTNKTYEP